jgi:prevent-host-death family protein
MPHIPAMNMTVNIGELKNHLSEYLEKVEGGEEIIVCKRNVPFATIIGIPQRKNRSQPGWAASSLRILHSIDGPTIPESDWNMLADHPGNES